MLFTGLTGRALPMVAGSAAAGLVSLWLLLIQRYRLVRITVALAVTTVLWASARAQYPLLLVFC